MQMINSQYFTDFVEDGVAVVEDVFTQEEVANLRNGLHERLLTSGINHDAILEGSVTPPNSADIRIKGAASKIFYSKFKIDALCDDRVYEIFKHFMINGIKPNDPSSLTHGDYDDVLPYIDRICWRLPDHIREEGGLGLHIDRNPWNAFANNKYYRPIQGFIALTDQYGAESGGLKVVKSFHKVIDEYFKSSYNTKEAQSTGSFYRLNNNCHTKLQAELQPIHCRAGSLVLWNNCLPHATCEKLRSFDTREVIYVSYLPNIRLNRLYWEQQAANFLANLAPPAYSDGDERADRDYDIGLLDVTQRRRLGVESSR